MIPAPPDVAATATPRAFGAPALAKKLAVSISASKSSTSVAPVSPSAARHAASGPASEPVCDSAAAAPCAPVASLHTTSGLSAAQARRAASISRRGSAMPSNRHAIARQRGSSASAAT